jgi:hypothetical protein
MRCLVEFDFSELFSASPIGSDDNGPIPERVECAVPPPLPDTTLYDSIPLDKNPWLYLSEPAVYDPDPDSLLTVAVNHHQFRIYLKGIRVHRNVEREMSARYHHLWCKIKKETPELYKEFTEKCF